MSNRTLPYYTQYAVTVNVQQKYPLLRYIHSHYQYSTKMIPCYTLYTISVSVKRDHSLLHCTQSLSVSTKTIPCITVHIQCTTRLLLATLYTVSNKTIPYCIVHSQCPTRPSHTTLYTVSVQQDHSYYTVHSLCPTRPFPITLCTVFNMAIPYNTEHSVQQDHFLPRCTVTTKS